ncbi:hypothetical protein PHJA_003019800, partial [Phtheirospermum japonicum]
KNKIEWSFVKQQKKKSTLSKKTLLLKNKNPTGPFPSNQTKKEGNPVEFLRFRMNLIRNMNHKREIPIKPITRIPATVPIIQRGILPVVSAIYSTSLQFHQVVMLET